MGLFGSKTILPLAAVFGGKYEILRLIGKGGMGEVYEAVERPGGRKVAVKVISATTADDEELLRRFKLEGKALSVVSHPNIVTVYETGQLEDINYIAMEYVEGQTIYQICKSMVIPDNEVSMLFLQMCEGIRILHEKNIIHRDIKPRNIIYQNENLIKILDFGIAKFYGDFSMQQTAVGVIVGTLLYMAPEVATGAPASFQSDIWSLGAIFYEMLTGVPLIRAKTTVEALSQLNNLKIQFPLESQVFVSREMQAIVSKMCAKLPAERYQSLDEVMHDLREFQTRAPSTDKWMYGTICKDVTNLIDVKRHLRAAGFTPILAKRILAEAIIEAGGTSSLDAEKTVAVPLKAQSITISKTTLQNSIQKLTAPGAVKVSQPPAPPPLKKKKTSVEESGPLEVGPATSSFIQSTQSSAEAISKSLVKEPWSWSKWLRLGSLSAAQEWALLIGAVAVLVVTAISRMEERAKNRLPNSVAKQEASTELEDSSEKNISLKESDRGALQEGENASSDETEVSETNEEDELEIAENDKAEDTPRVKKKKRSERKTRRSSRSRKARDQREASLKQPSLLQEDVSFIFDFRSVSSLTSDYGKFPTLRWADVSGAATYAVQISSSASFSQLVEDRLVKESAFDWEKALPGRFWWRVSAVDSYGQRGAFSRSGKLLVQLPQPYLENSLVKTFKFKNASEMKSQPSAFSFNWSSVPRASGYYIQSSVDPGFAKVIADWHTPVNQLEVTTAKSGTVFFRVAATDRQKRTVSGFSSPMKVSIQRLLDIPLPELKTPRDGDKILMPAGDPNFIIVFSWSQLKSASRYVLQVAKDSEFKEIVLARSSTKNRHTLGRELTEGKFYWRVKSADEASDDAWSEIGSFHIRK